MISAELENLVRIGKLKREPRSHLEFDGLVQSGAARLADAASPALAIESRFDLAYNAAHALSLAALRHRGQRSSNRYIVFRALEHTLDLPPATWRVLANCHDRRNRAEYGGTLDMDERLVTDLLAAAEAVLAGVRGLAGPGDAEGERP